MNLLTFFLENTTKNQKILFSCVLIPFLFTVGYLSIYDAGFSYDIFTIVSSNPEFLISMVFTAMVIAYSYFQFKGEYTIVEAAAHACAMLLALLVMYMTFFTTGTDLRDTVIFNGKITKATYQEPWTETVTTTSCDSKGSCTTTTHRVRHYAEYHLSTTNGIDGKVRINKGNYNAIAAKFKNNTETKTHHMGQTMSSRALGEGDVWTTLANGIVIPTSIAHDSINYIKASSSTVLRKQFLEIPKDVQKILRPYPKVKSSTFGPISFNHVIDTTNSIDTQKLNGLVNKSLAVFGASLQVNTIIYFVPESTSRGFINYLESSWGGFKKNDAVFVIAINKSKKPIWSESKALTKHTLFLVEIEDAILRESKTSTDAIEAITKQLRVSRVKENGFKRTPMAEYKYLIGSIDIPLSLSLLGVLLSCLLNLALWFIMVKVCKD